MTIFANFATLLVSLIGMVLVIALPIAGIYLIYKLVGALCWLIWRGVSGIVAALGFGFRGIGMGTSHIYSFVRGTVVDALRLVGAALTSVFMIPPILGNVFLGRWSAANHYGRAFEREIKEAWVRLYRLVIGNPIRLVGLKALTEGVENRLPEVMAHAPGADRPRGGNARFAGYRVTGSLPRGGSGARLYLAEPTREKYDHFSKNGMVCPGQVVIKAFSLEDGSTLPQIVRESRALTAAKELGLVLDHVLEGESFWYVMPYVDGSDLGVITQQLHTDSGDVGLNGKSMRDVLHISTQLLATLDRFHGAGLWHKDIKPANVIVSSGNQAHLVDFGLVTPLQSAMTLTTHGTEYFRDPEMVRLAMQGVKVHEVDGVKFDLYSMGAVLFSMIENSFPAHGNLSQIRKRCPESLRWVVSRAMADTKNRYASSREMLADVATILESADPYDVLPADLPSFGNNPSLAGAVDPKRYRSSSPTQGSFSPLDTPSVPPSEKARPIKRRISRGVLVAVAVALVVLTVGSEITSRAALRNSRHAARQSKLVIQAHERDHADTVISRAISVMNGRRDDLAAETVSFGCYRHEDHIHHESECSGDHDYLYDFPGTESFGLRDPYDVLIVNDLPPSMSADYLANVSRALDDADMQPRGLAADDAREIEWLAEARSAAGIGFPHNPDSVTGLEQFLSENEILDAVWWLSQGEGDGLTVSRFVTENGPSERIVTAVDLR